MLTDARYTPMRAPKTVGAESVGDSFRSFAVGYRSYNIIITNENVS